MNFNYNLSIKPNPISISFEKLASTWHKPRFQQVNDSFVSNPIYESLNTKEQLEMVVKSNARLSEILSKNNLPLKINIEALNKLKQGHMNDTRTLVAKLYSSLPQELKKDINLKDLQEAAMLHDYGKVLIPESILNKSGKLNADEQKIMELHSEFGYELLKNKGLSENTLNLVKYHHQNLKGTGYPAKEKNYDYGIEAQILATADKYSALREKRVYKSALGKYEALEIIAKEVNSGNISQDIYTALLKIV